MEATRTGLPGAILLAAALVLATMLGGCSGEDATMNYTLNLTGDSTYQTPHGGQFIQAALVRSSDSMVVARRSTVVANIGTSANGFQFTFANLLAYGESYQVVYWVDHNGGAPNGVCDTPPTDHGWSLPVSTVTSDVALTDAHDTGFDTAACDQFPALDLTVTGDDTYVGPHGTETMSMKVIRDIDGAEVGATSGTVDAATGDNVAFQFSFPGSLVTGVAYTVYYYAEHGGTAACDTPPTDHGWSLAAGPATSAVSLTDSHDTGFDTSVCTYFP